jgi:hypothetical protein
MFEHFLVIRLLNQLFGNIPKLCKSLIHAAQPPFFIDHQNPISGGFKNSPQQILGAV